MLGTINRRCVSAYSCGLCNIPTPIDQVLDGPIVQTHVKIDALCELRKPPEQHPGKKSWHMMHLLRQQGPLRTVCLQQVSDHMCLCPDYHSHHNAAKQDYSGVVKESTGEWNGALLSSVIRVGYVCMRVMDVHLAKWIAGQCKQPCTGQLRGGDRQCYHFACLF